MSDEVQSVVQQRSGQILSASTILKSDFFSNLQKLSLPEYGLLLALAPSATVLMPSSFGVSSRVDGAANFRKAPLTLSFNVPTFPKSLHTSKSGFLDDGKSVYGTGMPSIQG